MESESGQVSSWLQAFGAALARNDIRAVANFFGYDCYWRDLLAFTWTIKTFEGPDEITAMLAATLNSTQPSGWALAGKPTLNDGFTEAWLTFETNVGRGVGHLRLRGGRCWTLLTTLQELKGFEELEGRTRPAGVEQGGIKERKSWLDRREQEEAELGVTRQPYCVIIGGGQGGIALAARLKRLGVPTLVIEKNERAGDSWRKRYRSLVLHDPVWYDHLPYLPFPDHWPVFSPKDQMGDWLEMYAKVMELNYWSSTLCTGARYDEEAGEWEVSLNYGGDRSKLYSQAALEAGITTEIADLTVASTPFKLLPAQMKPVYETIRRRDAQLYEGLEKAGFLFDFGEDGSGIHSTYLRRGAGYYIDVGASQLIIDGFIRLKSNTTIKGINPRSVTLDDGTELPADLIVCATGYGSMNEWAAKLISPEVADAVGKCWGLGSGTRYDPGPWVGELRNMWKPTQQPGLWFHGGNLMQSRHYSLYLALQLKARMEDIPTPVYYVDPVHHKR